MVGRHAVAVAVHVLAHQAALDPVAVHGQRHRLAGGVHEGAAQRPALVQVVAGHHAHIVPAVPPARELAPLVDGVERAEGAAPGIAHPTVQPARALLEEELQSVAVAVAEHELVVEVGVHRVLRLGAFGVLDQVPHVLVVHLHASLVGAVLEVTEVPHGHLVADLGLHPAAAGHPHVGGQADAAEAGQVHVLVVAGVAGLHAGLAVDAVTHAQARLQAPVALHRAPGLVLGDAVLLAAVVVQQEVVRPHVAEVAQPQARVQADGVGEVELAERVGRGLVRVQLLLFAGVEGGLAALCGDRAWRVGVEDVLPSVLQRGAGAGVVVEVHLQAVVLDAALQGEGELVLLGLEAEAVVAEGGGGVHEQLGPEHVVPAGAHDGVAPGDAEVGVRRITGAEVEHITPEVPAHVEAVLVAQAVVQLGVQVVEVVARSEEVGALVDEGLGEHVDVGAAAAHDEGAAVLHQRAFQREA